MHKVAIEINNTGKCHAFTTVVNGALNCKKNIYCTSEKNLVFEINFIVIRLSLSI